MKSAKGFILIILAFLLSTAFACSKAADVDKKSYAEGKIAWKSAIFGQIADFEVDKNNIYVAAEGLTEYSPTAVSTIELYALNRFTGKNLWTASLEISIGDSRIIVDDKSIAVLSSEGSYLIDITNGQIMKKIIDINDKAIANIKAKGNRKLVKYSQNGKTYKILDNKAKIDRKTKISIINERSGRKEILNIVTRKFKPRNKAMYIGKEEFILIKDNILYLSKSFSGDYSPIDIEEAYIQAHGTVYAVRL